MRIGLVFAECYRWRGNQRLLKGLVGKLFMDNNQSRAQRKRAVVRVLDPPFLFYLPTFSPKIDKANM